MKFLKENVKLSVMYPQNYDDFLRPLEVALKYGMTCKDLIELLKSLLDEIEVFIKARQSEHLLKQLDCTILFRLIRENIDDEGKEIMGEFIKQDMVKKMRCISLEITKMRGFCISQQTLEETRQTLKKREYDEAVDALMMFISTGNYADLKLIEKRDKKKNHHWIHERAADFDKQQTWRFFEALFICEKRYKLFAIKKVDLN